MRLKSSRAECEFKCHSEEARAEKKEGPKSQSSMERQEKERAGGRLKVDEAGGTDRGPLEPQSLIRALDRGQRELPRTWRGRQRPCASELGRERERNGWLSPAAKKESEFDGGLCKKALASPSRPRSLRGGMPAFKAPCAPQKARGRGDVGKRTCFFLENEESRVS